jgi:hypothetical protein
VTTLAPGPVTTIDYLSRRVVIGLAFDRIKAIRWHADFATLRRTPDAWKDRGSRHVEQGRVDTAKELRELLALLRAVGFKGKRPGRLGR